MNELLESIAHAIDYFAIAVLVLGFVIVLISSGPKLVIAIGKQSKDDFIRAFRAMRLELGQTLLLALEILIVADVIYSIVHRTMEDIAILGVTVIIRIALSYFLNLELDHLRKESNESG
ncbi:MAG: DUF1622 domain-containing protein [Pseudomonadota bacterium]